MDKPIQQMVDRFPNHRAAILHLWATDADFRDLCKDYMLSLRLVARATAAQISPCRMSEYVTLVKDLETDLYITIAQVNTTITGQR